MSFNAGSIVATLKANVDGFKQDLNKASESAKTASSKMSQSFKGVKDSIERNQAAIQGMSMKFAAVSAAALLTIRSWTNAFIAQERAEARLAQVTRQTTNATNEQIESLKNQAAALQNVGVVGDEITIFGQSQLATFALQSEAIEKLVPSMLDMAVATKGVNVQQQDMIDIGNMIGKVMGGQVGALSRVGVTFSEAQAEILKTGTEMEKASALSEILAQNFGGLNEAMRNTTEGSMQVASNAWGDFKEQMGEAVAPAITQIAQLLEGLTMRLQSMSPQMKSAIANGVLFVGILAGIVAPLLLFISFIPGMIGGFAAISTMLTGIGIAISFIGAPLLALVGFIGLVVLAFQTDFLGIRTTVVETFEGVMSIIELFKMNAPAAFELLVFNITAIWEIFSTYFTTTIQNLVNLWNSIVITITLAWQSFTNTMKSAFNNAVSFVIGIFTSFWAGFQALYNAGLSLFTTAWNATLDAIYNVSNAIFENIKNIFKGVINWITEQINSLIRLANGVTTKLSFGMFEGISEIPQLAAGGIVTRPTLAMIGEGGQSEAVIPLDRLGEFGGGGVNIIINDSLVADEESARNLLEKAFASMNLAT